MSIRSQQGLIHPDYSHNEYEFSSEAVSEGHPDKICDQLSDMLLDYCLTLDPEARVAIETFATTEYVILGGEVSGNFVLKQDTVEELVRQTIKAIGYAQDPFNWRTVKILNLIHEQSQEIVEGVFGKKEEGAGDQGIMFGFACDETDVLMPATIYYANLIMKNIMDAIRSGEITGLGPDGKSQITLRYNENNQPFKASTILVSIQHIPDYNQDKVKSLIKPIIERTLPSGWMCGDEALFINPSGKFTMGGPGADTGLTGRKIIVDTYGGAAPHGGGAFSGKDPSKVDRSAAYMARYLAKNIVASGLAKKCLIELAYAIGVAQPLSIYVNTFGTSVIEENEIKKRIVNNVDLSPRGIRNYLKLDRPIYKITSAYGHFGRAPEENGSFSWEKTDLKL